MLKAKEQKVGQYSERAGDTVIDALRNIYVEAVAPSYLLYKQLICFRRYIGVEIGGDSESTEEKTKDIEEYTYP